jgi:seryl-tRNA synthetase
MTNFIIDGIIMVLLTFTIIYAVKLNSKLSIIRSQKDLLANNLRAFTEATEAAILAVEELQTKGESVSRQIEAQIKKGQTMADDIEFLLNRTTKRMQELKTDELKAKVAAGNAKVTNLSQEDIARLLREKQEKQAYA